MTRTPTGRRKGAQSGNVNRLKHGFYSRRIALEAGSLAAGSAAADPAFGIALIRKRLVEMIRRQESGNLHDWLAYERGLSHYISLICSLAREQSRGRLALQLAARATRQSRQTLPASSAGKADVRVAPEAGASDDAVPDSFLIRTSDPNSRSSRDLPVGRAIRTADFSSNSNTDLPQKRSKNEPVE